MEALAVGWIGACEPGLRGAVLDEGLVLEGLVLGLGAGLVETAVPAGWAAERDVVPSEAWEIAMRAIGCVGPALADCGAALLIGEEVAASESGIRNCPWQVGQRPTLPARSCLMLSG